MNICCFNISVVPSQEKPYKLNATSSSITIGWVSWDHVVTEPMAIKYKVLYREHGTGDWITAGDLLPDTDNLQEHYEVTQLKLNQRYAFRIIPIVVNYPQDGQEYDGHPSSVAEYFKTSCAGKNGCSITTHRSNDVMNSPLINNNTWTCNNSVGPSHMKTCICCVVQKCSCNGGWQLKVS